MANGATPSGKRPTTGRGVRSLEPQIGQIRAYCPATDREALRELLSTVGALGVPLEEAIDVWDELCPVPLVHEDRDRKVNMALLGCPGLNVWPLVDTKSVRGKDRLPVLMALVEAAEALFTAAGFIGYRRCEGSGKSSCEAT